jgi:hypothetical protein
MPPKPASNKPATATKAPASATKTPAPARKAPVSSSGKKAPIVGIAMKKRKKPRRECWSSYIYKGNPPPLCITLSSYLFGFDSVDRFLRLRDSCFSCDECDGIVCAGSISTDLIEIHVPYLSFHFSFLSIPQMFLKNVNYV